MSPRHWQSEKLEVDFLTIIDSKAHDLVEVKLSDSSLSSNLSYFTDRLHPTHPVQVVLNLPRDLTVKGIPVNKVLHWLQKQA